MAPPAPSHASSRTGRPLRQHPEVTGRAALEERQSTAAKGVKTLAAGGARHGRRSRRRSNRGGSGVDQGALVPCNQRRRSEWPGLAGARAGGGGGVGRARYQVEEDEGGHRSV
jgi:hypothetical protein